MALKKIEESIARAGIAKNEAEHQKRVRAANRTDSVENAVESMWWLMASAFSHVKG
jgi:hypothetical protein